LDKEATKWGKKKRKIPVDKKLLNDLMVWRKKLANSIRKYPRINNLTEEEMDECIQRILDRLIFIRTCEDRQIEPTILISNFRESQQRGKRCLQAVLKKIFRDFDKGYNSRIFEPHLSEDLRIGNEVFIEIIEGLYETKDKSIRYDFSAIDADVLGSIYEQYLGHILKKTPKRATLKEKHQHRKEHGIYYTPKYIVDYIVKNTVGVFLKEKSYNECMNLKILDPACGSGSFLIRAFGEIDNYLTEKRSQKGKLDFDTFRRKEILGKNIYGVDLDRQAVEIAQLNLLLKTLSTRERLPMLKNICQGNSLISGSEQELLKYFGKDWQSKHPFNWQEEFPEVFAKGGFDVVIGNPPYVNIHNLTQDDIEYFKTHFISAEKQFDLFCLMIEKSLFLLNEGGLFGFIIPNLFLKGYQYNRLRKFIIENTNIRSILDFGDKVFEGVQMPTCILILQKVKSPKLSSKILFRTSGEDRKKFIETRVTQKNYTKTENYSFLSINDDISLMIDKIHKRSIELGALTKITRGLELGKRHPDILFSKQGNSVFLLSGEDIKRYQITKCKYLKLKTLKQFRKNRLVFENPKIILREAGSYITATYDENNNYTLRTLYNMNLVKSNYNLKYILGILNSSIIQFYYEMHFKARTDVFPKIRIGQANKLPIRKIDFSNPKDKQMHDNLVKLVDKMLELNKKLQKATTNTDYWHKVKDAIDKTDRIIDEKVYELYSLSNDEVKIVERPRNKN